jgi:hypothetical protein
MEMLLRFEDGTRVQAVPLAGDRGCLRLAVQNHADTVELRQCGNLWYDEFGTGVDIEAITTDGEIDVAELCSRLLPRAYRAAG